MLQKSLQVWTFVISAVVDARCEVREYGCQQLTAGFQTLTNLWEEASLANHVGIQAETLRQTIQPA